MIIDVIPLRKTRRSMHHYLSLRTVMQRQGAGSQHGNKVQGSHNVLSFG